VFGSVARGEARQDSDLDLLVDFEPGAGVVIGVSCDLAAAQNGITSLLMRYVDRGDLTRP